MWPVTGQQGALKIARCHVSAIHRPRLIVYKSMSTEVLYFTRRHQDQQRAKRENVLMSESWLPNEVALSGIRVADSGTQCIAQS